MTEIAEVPFVQRYSVDYVVHGDDVSTDAEGNDTYRLVKHAGMYKECKRTEGVSTTDAISRVLFGKGRPNMDDGIDHGLVKSFAEDPALPGQASLHTVQNIASSASSTLPSPASEYLLATVFPLAPEQRVIYVEGPFDLFSAEDVGFLASMATEDVVVIVGIWASRDIQQATGTEPILSFQERALSVLQCKVCTSVPRPLSLSLLTTTYVARSRRRTAGRAPRSGSQRPFRLRH